MALLTLTGRFTEYRGPSTEHRAPSTRTLLRVESPPRVRKDYHRWYTSRLGREMGVVVYGHWGVPLLAFPTSGGDERELEGQGMIGALAAAIDAGTIKIYAVGSNGDQS